MTSQSRLSELLVESEAFKDLEHPVILTSGELGIYYINTEKLLFDNGLWEQHGDDSLAMIKYCIQRMREEPRFKEVIEIVADDVNRIINWANIPSKSLPVISGGQRRDWIFSGPVAHTLQLLHVSLYKDSRKTIIDASAETELPVDKTRSNMSIAKFWPVHVVDLLTKGSSVYDPTKNPPTGWVPMLRDEGAQIENLRTIVSRKQGGEEILGIAGVSAKSYVEIDKKFLRTYSRNPHRAALYFDNPASWAEGYLQHNGIDALLPTFDPAGKKKDRALKFVEVYKEVLQKSNLLGDLKTKVERDYSYSIK